MSQQPFVHLHVHTHYSILDGQASVPALVDKAIKDNMRGMAITDHGNMFGIKEFYNYVSKKNGAVKSAIKELTKKIESLKAEGAEQSLIVEAEAELEAEKTKIFKPIIGCEMYVARGASRFSKQTKQEQGGYHLIVLAKNLKGYHNLIKLVSHAWTEGFYMRPRTDREDLKKYSEGLIVASACLGGEVPRKIIQGSISEAEEAVKWYKDVFGDDYYIELQRHKATVPRANHETYKIQEQVNKVLLELAAKYNVKVICTNDVHFVNEEHAEAHDRLICLSTSKDLDDPTRMLYSKQEWFKTTEEMNRVFADIPEALANTNEILDKVEFYSIDNPPIMPTFNIPEEFGTEEGYRTKYSEQDIFDEFTRDENGKVVLSQEDAEAKIKRLGGYEKLYRIKLEADYLSKLAYDGAAKRYGELTPELQERMNFELYIMKTMGFPGYFLIVQDFIAAARNMGVSVGPGRGSAAGSMVAYCLGITQIDPIKYDLLFERFLNPDRISLPDIDIDFDDDGRGEVLRWVTEKYGANKVAHIITYGTMATKMAIRDVARVEKLPLSEADRLAKLIPAHLPEVNGKEPKITVKNCIAGVPELKEAAENGDELTRETMRYAEMLEGNVRGTGVHACGTIICRDDITDWVPVSTADDKETKEKLLVTQYEGSVIEDTGLIKMDFLGLKTLSIIKEAIKNIKLSKGIDVDIDNVPIDDKLTYELYSAGRTVGTFQFESPGMQSHLRNLKPTTFEDLIAMNALYRPGPMDYIPQFIKRKHGIEPIEYDIPIMEQYLKDTYGITVYQEQVMLLSRLLGNFTRGMSDALRKAMGKKIRSKLDELKPKFIEGGVSNGHDPKVLEKIWADWEKFASYAFNKSHATCYSWVAYQTAYLKAHYPSEYMAAVLSRNISDITEIKKFMDECKAMGIKVLEPDVNESNLKFTVNKEGNIRFGLGAVKGVGENAAKAIIDEREKNGLYTSLFDFAQRVNLNACNRKNVENLVLAGAFDNFKEACREQFFTPNQKGELFLDLFMRYGTNYQIDKQTQQNSLFGADMVEIPTPEVPKAEKWSDLERLNKERELVGVYLSSHPLEGYSLLLDYVCNTTLQSFSEDLEKFANSEVIIGGIVTSYREGITKKGSPYGIITIEDYSGTAEIALFSKDYINYSAYGKEGLYLFIQGRVEIAKYNNRAQLRIGKITLMDEAMVQYVKELTIVIDSQNFNSSMTNFLSETIGKYEGGAGQLSFEIVDKVKGFTVPLYSRSKKIKIESELVNILETLEGIEVKVNGKKREKIESAEDDDINNEMEEIDLAYA
ncbi:MAG: DNA polymerase III subunit alpha [Bacteroidales bacterium]|nr:DNA polymerase III subunit alpha [Bacteroidales bacterium]MBQ7818258.1 DNA polymerase III subunit alpha [Bacteroidales bacterium]